MGSDTPVHLVGCSGALCQKLLVPLISNSARIYNLGSPRRRLSSATSLSGPSTKNMHKRPAALPSYIPRPPKRRRRTATSVLAGYFDPRPPRDYFTDMANSNDSQSPYNSIVGHGPGILFDVRPQDEKDKEIARERKRLLKNAKRREKDIEKRKERQEQKLRKAQRRVERVQSVVRARSPHPPGDGSQVAPATDHAISHADSSGETDTFVSSTIPGVTYTPGHLATALPHLHAGPPARWSPYYSEASRNIAPLSHETFTFSTSTVSPPTRSLQPGPLSHTVVGHTPANPSVTISALSPPSAVLPISPPTPCRSVSSITSRTSSKRPHTPRDVEISPRLPHTGDHADFGEPYPSMDIDQEGRRLDSNSVGGPSRDKDAFNSASPHREPFCDRPRTLEDPEYSATSPYQAPSWFIRHSSNNAIQTGGHGPWEPAYGSVAHSSNTVSPALEHTPQPSISHRRNALSLADLLSPPSMPYLSPRSVPPVPSIPEAPEIVEPCNPTLQHDISLDCSVDHISEPSLAASSTVESSCLSPLALASSLSGETIPPSVNESPKQVMDKLTIPGAHGHSFTTVVMDIMETTEELPRAASQPIVLGPAIELEGPEVVDGHINDWEEAREDSATPEPDRKNQGRASKAILVFQSEDDLTDLEDHDTPRRFKVTASASKSVSKGGVGATRERSLASDERSVSKSTASPSASVGGSVSKKRKRVPVKRGWKGWIEVEVDEEHVPPKQFSLDILPPGERRTRSGKQFDG